MLKTLVILGITAFIVWFFFLKKRPIKKEEPQRGDSMVECTHCKTFVLQNEALISNGKYFCSQECLLKG